MEPLVKDTPSNTAAEIQLLRVNLQLNAQSESGRAPEGTTRLKLKEPELLYPPSILYPQQGNRNCEGEDESIHGSRQEGELLPEAERGG